MTLSKEIKELFRPEIEAARNEGIIKGRNEGIIKGRNEGIIKGRNEGRQSAINEMIQKLYQSKFSISQIIEITMLSEEEILKVLSEKQ